MEDVRRFPRKLRFIPLCNSSHCRRFFSSLGRTEGRAALNPRNALSASGPAPDSCGGVRAGPAPTPGFTWIYVSFSMVASAPTANASMAPSRAVRRSERFSILPSRRSIFPSRRPCKPSRSPHQPGAGWTQREHLVNIARKSTSIDGGGRSLISRRRSDRACGRRATLCRTDAAQADTWGSPRAHSAKMDPRAFTPVFAGSKGRLHPSSRAMGVLRLNAL